MPMRLCAYIQCALNGFYNVFMRMRNNKLYDVQPTVEDEVFRAWMGSCSPYGIHLFMFWSSTRYTALTLE